MQVQLEKRITLCSLYLGPSLEDHLFDGLGRARQLDVSDIQGLIDQLPRPFLLMGDFNAKHTMWGNANCDRWGYIHS